LAAKNVGVPASSIPGVGTAVRDLEAIDGTPVVDIKPVLA
jgi:tRNA (Thr-GGU) A37 N-methylase